MTEWTQLFEFHGGGDDKDLDVYGCCYVAHAKRTLHTKYPNNISNAMLYRSPTIKQKQVITCTMFYSVSELV